METIISQHKCYQFGVRLQSQTSWVPTRNFRIQIILEGLNTLGPLMRKLQCKSRELMGNLKHSATAIMSEAINLMERATTIPQGSRA